MTTSKNVENHKAVIFTFNITKHQLNCLYDHSMTIEHLSPHHSGVLYNITVYLTQDYVKYIDKIWSVRCEFMRSAIDEFIVNYESNDGLLGLNPKFAVSRSELIRIIIRDSLIQYAKSYKNEAEVKQEIIASNTEVFDDYATHWLNKYKEQQIQSEVAK